MDLARHSEVELARRAFELGAGHHDIDQFGIDRRDRAADRERRRAVDSGEIGERAMRLDMPDPMPDGARHALKGADLVDDRLFDVLGLFALDHATAKPPDVVKARMRADPDAV